MNQKRILNIQKCEFIMGIEKPEQLHTWMTEHQDIIALAFIGRSNVGKSSTINTIFGKHTARVSKTPGRTRQINIFEFELQTIEKKFYFFDLPGYGHAKVSKQMSQNWDELMTCFFELIPFKTLLFNIQDARHPFQEVDQGLFTFLKKIERETYLIFNKIDKLKTQKEKALLSKKLKELMPKLKMVKQIFQFSAETKTGLAPIEESILNFLHKKMIISET